MSWHVYALKDPQTDEVRYVGKSVNPSNRLYSHRSRSAASAVGKWVASLLATPVLDILASAPSEREALALEVEWVTRLRESGCDLLNSAPPGREQGRRGRRRFFGLGERVAARRRELGLTQTELASRTGVEQARVCRIEHGSRDQVTAETAVVLARALGVDVDWLVTGDRRAAKGRAA